MSCSQSQSLSVEPSDFRQDSVDGIKIDGTDRTVESWQCSEPLFGLRNRLFSRRRKLNTERDSQRSPGSAALELDFEQRSRKSFA